MINLHQKVFESISHISYSATINDERGKQFSIEKEKRKKSPELNRIDK